MTQTVIDFWVFGPKSGLETVADAACWYAEELLGGEGYQLVVDPVTDATGQAFRVVSDDSDLLAGPAVSETQLGQYFVGAHWTCQKSFQSITQAG